MCSSERETDKTPVQSSVMISVSGIRGVVGGGLSPELIVRYAAALGTLYGPGRVLVGRDSRISGEMVRSAVFSALISVGCDPVDLGICPTPTVEYAVQESNAVAGIIITASHNPVEWNALKLLNGNGLFLNEKEGGRITRIIEDHGYAYKNWETLGTAGAYEGAITDHIDAVLRIPYIDVDVIRKKRFRVAYDCVNGAGGTILPELFESLGCETHPLNLDPSGRFAHAPEPVPANIRRLSDVVRATGSDIGFAVDPDVDRLALVSEKGTPLGEEYTIVLAVHHVLSKEKGPVAVNVSTTRAVQEVCRTFDVPCFLTPVGEIHVVSRMLREKAVIGGEGNGGIILPSVHPGRDAPVGIAVILQLLTEFGGPLSALWESMPHYRMTKEKIHTGETDPETLIQRLREVHQEDRIDLTDGLRIDRTGGWVHVRKSNTEPVIRVIAESSTDKKSKQLCEETLQRLRDWM